MEKKPEDLTGMDAASAREYILHFITTLKLTEKKIQEMDAELIKWNSRISLARDQGNADLVLEAEKAAGEIKGRRDQMIGEAAELKGQIELMRKQIPGLAARERSIDPDLLEQELLIATGRLPGDEEKAKTDRLFRDIEQKNSADTALEALKEKMAKNKAD
jgi:phage shock protein A